MKNILSKIFKSLIINTVIAGFSGGIADAQDMIFSNRFSVENSQNLYDPKDISRVNSTDFTVNPALRYSGLNFAAMVALSVDHQGTATSTISNTSIMMSSADAYKILDSSWKLNYSLGGVLPTNEEIRKDTGFYGAISAGGSISNPELFSSFPMSLTWSMGLNKNFNKYDLAADGSPISEYSLRNRLMIDKSITQRFSTSLLFDYINAITYRGYPREKFASAIDLNYEANKNFAFNLGVSTEGNAKKANEYDSNITLFDENASVIRIGMTITNK